MQSFRKKFVDIIEQDKIYVTQEHIDSGDGKSPDKCPLTLAIEELRVDNAWYFSTFDFIVRYSRQRVGNYYGNCNHVYLSDGLQEWVHESVNGNAVEPITVYIDSSEPVCLHLKGETRSYMSRWPKGF